MNDISIIFALREIDLIVRAIYNLEE